MLIKILIKFFFIYLILLFFSACSSGPSREQIQQLEAYRMKEKTINYKKIIQRYPEYYQLSKSQKNASLSGKVLISPKLIKIDKLIYPETMRNSYQEGDVYCLFIVNSDSSVRNVRCFSYDNLSIDDVFIKAAEEYLVESRFVPGYVDGHKTDFFVSQKISFRLDDLPMKN